MARHRIHSLAFKKQVVQEYAAGATLNGLAREHDLSRNLIRIWIAKCESGEFDADIEAATLLGDCCLRLAMCGCGTWVNIAIRPPNARYPKYIGSETRTLTVNLHL